MALPGIRASHGQDIIKGCMKQPATLRAAGFVVLIVVTLAPLVAEREQGSLPRVQFVATGGTISNKEGGRPSAATRTPSSRFAAPS